MNNMENGSNTIDQPELTPEQKEIISANSRVVTEKEIGTLGLNYLSEGNKTWLEVVIWLVTDYCIKNKIVNPSFITNKKTRENIESILTNNRIKWFPQISRRSIITNSLKKVLISK